MSLVTSICIVGKGMRLQEDIEAFFTQYHSVKGGWLTDHPIPKRVSDLAEGNKGMEMAVYCVAYNYCDVDEFKKMFHAHDWCDRPTLIARWGENDILKMSIGDEAMVERMTHGRPQSVGPYDRRG